MTKQSTPRSSIAKGWFNDEVNSRLEMYYNSNPVGYIDATGIGLPGRGTVTQATNHSTGVTVNATSGTITLASADLAAGAEATFTVTNSAVAANDTVFCCVGTNNDATGEPFCFVSDVSAGSFDITLTNLHATTAAWNDASTINFAVIKSGA